jgi:hypothetical protein
MGAYRTLHPMDGAVLLTEEIPIVTPGKPHQLEPIIQNLYYLVQFLSGCQNHLKTGQNCPDFKCFLG